MKLTLHIGIEKTGTSSIQSMLNANRDVLLEKYKILYPKTGLWSDFSHHKIGFAAQQTNLYEKHSSLNDIFTGLQKEIQTSGCNHVVISTEILRSLHDSKNFKQFVELLSENFKEIELLVFLRNQPYWLLSMYNQFVKDPVVKYKMGFDVFCNFFEKKADFNRMIETWENTGKISKVSLFRYLEKNSNEYMSSVEQILNYLHVEAKDIKKSKADANISLNRFQLDFTRKMNTQDLEIEQRRKLNKIIFEHFKDKDANYLVGQHAIASLEKKQNIAERYLESNATLCKKHFTELSVLFPEIDEDIETEPMNTLNQNNFASLLAEVTRRNL